ncbi:hypothetical protein G6011_09460 [Alternaria panax]|uniref:Uncharacterized protein n=1 Tax=Alternaria panax TaxID=48097 RepID=A0AAD4IBD1_9PLEO|nr:hypothetical protein G6011_09460 [Alternaria panax]
MYQPPNELGVNYFMSNFIVDDPAMALLHYLPDFYTRTGHSDPALRKICAAVGLVGLVNKAHNKDMFRVAANNYGAAIRAINTALLCPKKAVNDCIVASVYLAAMFEALIIPRPAGMDNASTHLAGAVSVAHLVLKQQKQTEITYQLCNTIIKTVIMNSWIQEVPLPPNFFEFKRLVEKKAERVSVHDSFLDIIMNLIQLKQEYQNAANRDPMAMIQRALAIDANLDEYARDLAQKAPFETYQLSNADDSRLAHKGYYHLYPKHLHAHLWNNVRTTHIRLHQAIMRQCDNLASFPELIAQRASSKALIISKIMELLASVPQLAGYVKDIHITPSSKNTTLSGQQGSPPGQETYQRSIHTSIPQYRTHSLYHILYQLYLHGSEPGLPQFTKYWIQQRNG